MFEGLRDKTSAFSGSLAHAHAPVHLTVDGATEQVRGDLVSGGFFQALGLSPLTAACSPRTTTATRPAIPVVVLGHGFFERRFAGDPSVVGRTVSSTAIR